MKNSTIERLKNFVLDCLAPSYCLLCGNWGPWVCKKCLPTIEKVDNSVCPVCFKGAEGVVCVKCRSRVAFDALSFPYWFDTPVVARLIHFYKYTGLRELADFFSDSMEESIAYYPFSSQWVVVPMPLHRQKFNARGFNQAELMARHIAEKRGLSVERRALRRVRVAEVQASLNKKEREKNLAGVFACAGSGVAGKSVLLIDDVATTLSTLNECARTLKKAGVKFVWCVVAARTQ